MASFPFYLFAILTVLSAGGVVLNRNSVNAAVCLLVSFVSLAGLFVLLDAYFLAVLQVLVYAGAVAVLFVFIVMVVDVKGGDPHKPYRKIAAGSGLVALALLAIGVLSVVKHGRLVADAEAVPATGASLRAFGEQLFTTYLLPVEVTGFLLLIAMLGVVVLSKKHAEEIESRSQETGGLAPEGGGQGPGEVKVTTGGKA
jgi:NADH-quinone oxidoreductase subunit J